MKYNQNREERNNADYVEFAELNTARLQILKTLRCCGLGKENI